MNLIVAGSRTFNDYGLLCRKLDHLLSRKNPGDVVIFSGRAPGADELGERYAKERGIRVRPFPAAWDDLDAPGAVIRYRTRNGKKTPYNAKAGHDRNKLMAVEAAKGEPALALFWDGKSKGSKDMLDLATKMGFGVRVVHYLEEGRG